MNEDDETLSGADDAAAADDTTPDGSAERAETFARRIGAVLDPALRVAYLRHELAKLSRDDLARTLAHIHHHAEEKRAPFPQTMLACSLALEQLPEQRSAAATAARALGLDKIAALLTERDEEEGRALPVPDFGKGRPLTLGERKSLARGRDRRLLQRALRDPDPTVMRILLKNPALTEDDIVRLCARRPAAPSVLATVFRSTKWIVRPRVRMALVQNPHLAESLALQIVPLLSPYDAKRVALSSQLSEALLAACRARAKG